MVDQGGVEPPYPLYKNGILPLNYWSMVPPSGTAPASLALQASAIT